MPSSGFKARANPPFTRQRVTSGVPGNIESSAGHVFHTAVTTDDISVLPKTTYKTVIFPYLQRCCRILRFVPLQNSTRKTACSSGMPYESCISYFWLENVTGAVLSRLMCATNFQPLVPRIGSDSAVVDFIKSSKPKRHCEAEQILLWALPSASFKE
jgi:hypothetical protein